MCKKRALKWRKNHCTTVAHQRSRSNARLRAQVLLVCSGTNPPECACCGKVIEEFLTIDHVNNNGSQEREKLKSSIRPIERYLVRMNYPDGYQVLCWNCNSGRAINGGVCPHEERRAKI